MSNQVRVNPMPGQFLNLNGVAMHVHSAGRGAPAVVMEAAIGDFSLTWSLVQPQVARFTRAISYDRLGLGWSEASPMPRTGETLVAELRRLLGEAGIPGPYILVSHSFSALLARLYAYRYPEEIAGLVLLDPAHEDQFLRFPQPIREMFIPLRDAQIAQLQQNAETIRLNGPAAAVPVVMPPATFPAEISAAYTAQSIADPVRVETMIEELRQLETTQQQVRDLRAASLGQIPLTVISHGQPQAVPGMSAEINQAYEDAWQEMQREIAAMSTRGKQVIAEESGHMIHHQQPDLVVQHIRQMVEAVRNRDY